MIYDFGSKKYDFTSRTYVMGILNITPDSFSDGGKYYDGKLNLEKVIKDALQMEQDGADFIDVGGESTRPGSENISIDEELNQFKTKQLSDILMYGMSSYSKRATHACH